MVDPGLSHVIVKRLNRWFRKRSRPHGLPDYTYRGTRLVYNTTYRVFISFCCLMLLSLAGALYFIPSLFSDKPPLLVLAIKIAWAGIVVVIALAPFEAFREFVVVNDEHVLRFNLFGRQSSMEWKEISRIEGKLDENELKLISASGKKLKLNRCYNGWQDFLEISGRHLSPELHGQLMFLFLESRPLSAETTEPHA